MQKIMITMLLLLLGSMSAKGQTCQWAEKISGNRDEFAKSIVVDRDGNVYVAGNFTSDTLNFNNGKTVKNSLPKSDVFTNNEIYIAKYNSSGKCLWTQRIIANTNRSHTISDMAIDTTGNLYIIGSFDSITLYFDENITLNSNYNGCAYIAKYNSNGKCLWAEKIDGKGEDVGLSIALDSSENLYVSGQFISDTLHFNNDISPLLRTGYYADGYFAKYNSNGKCLWAEIIAGEKNDQVNNIVVDVIGNVYISGGTLSSTLNFNNGKLLNLSGFYDGYIAKYNTNGQCLWAEEIAGNGGDDSPTNLVIDGNSNLYIAGWFKCPTLNFNNGVTLTHTGFQDGYITKYNTNGLCQWAEKIVGNDDQFYIHSMDVDQSNNLYVAGRFSCSIIRFNNDKTLNLSFSADGFIAKYNSNGICQWANKIAGSDGYEEISSLCFDGSNNFYICGDFSSSINFDNNIILTNNNGINKYMDAYIAKYSQNPDDVTSTDGFSFAINPNPVKDLLTIDISAEIMATATLTIYDLNGNEILTAYEGMLKQGGNSLQINCQALPNGVYNVILQTDTQKLTKRFVVAR